MKNRATDARAFAGAVRSLAAAKVKTNSRALPEYPFDRKLLAGSRLYAISRYLYVEGGGKFEAKLVSAGRTLSSPILLEQRIEYSPLECELIWRATDSIERRNPASAFELKTFLSCVFHEQNHRILWKLLPPAPASTSELRRYLNFAEALVIVTDMALADELGPKLAGLYKTVGVLYDPGSAFPVRKLSKRAYRNYLQSCLHATYLALEGFDGKVIAKVIPQLYSNTPQAGHAVARAANLNRGFILGTNLIWQRRHRHQSKKALATRRGAPLRLSDDPLSNWQQYVFAEKWFDHVEL